MNILFAGIETNKNVSSEDYYAYHLMIRRGQDNIILRCCELCQQFMVDMYVEIESEQLQYLRYNQQKLRAEEYIHLRDAIVSNADTAEIGNYHSTIIVHRQSTSHAKIHPGCFDFRARIRTTVFVYLV